MAFNIYERTEKGPEDLELTNFGIEYPNLLISHEKVTFEVRDTAKLMRKLRRFLAAVDSILEEVGGNGSQRTAVVQELGGFISLLATYYAARSRGLDNVFISYVILSRPYQFPFLARLPYLRKLNSTSTRP
jgi:hypothetical protein